MLCAFRQLNKALADDLHRPTLRSLLGWQDTVMTYGATCCCCANFLRRQNYNYFTVEETMLNLKNIMENSVAG
jgi:hypothetical protein